MFLYNFCPFFKVVKALVVKVTHINCLPSFFPLPLPPPRPSAWAFVGQASNMRPRASYSINPATVIVSRSHAGEVKNYIRDALGNSTKIIAAGGAGEYSFYLGVNLEFLHMTLVLFMFSCCG